VTLTADRSTRKLDPALLKLMFVLLTGALAVVFDTTIVSVALQTLVRQLRVPVATVQWVTTAYLLALGMVVPVTGWLMDRFGGKRVWIAALTVFFAGSMASSLAWDAPSLIAFRVVQGIGGGLMLPVLTTLIMRAAAGRNLGSVTAVVALPALLGPILGPVLGGLIVNELSWRWIFWINVPFCVAGLLLAWRLMPADRGDGSAGRLDAVGLLLVSPGIALVLVGLSRVSTAGGFGHASVYLPLAVGALLIAAFTVRALRMGEAALVDLRLFRVSSFTASTALLFLSGFVLYGAMLILPLYFQDVRGYGALGAGLLLVPQGVGVLASRSLAGLLTDRIGPRWVVFGGLVITALGTVPFALAGAGTREWILIVALAVRGVGLGAVTIPLMAGAYQGLNRAEIADASISTRASQQIGGSFGGGVLAVVLSGQLAHHAGARGYDVTFWWTIGFTVVAILLALRLPSRATS
jgi:EmrB/QacA subfamily drug resistance transporter